MNKEQNSLVSLNSDYKRDELSDNELMREKRKAAYALNLCTVSVSQIIDYEDLNILEQEYEMILNNLNLEFFPKDEPLLHILKHILDTVTFFRIYEGDKKLLDKKYQHKMKNAIWSAIPNFTFVAAGGPYTIALSAIAAIGMGYMNYRKEKAKISIENEEEEWKLQRSAIEQFNGLRRELFDTAWRLADKYGFKDEDRLTEKQISAYNKILMDPLPLRKFERLKSIEKFFNAYPPFWYYLGNAAYEVAKIYNDPDIMYPDSVNRNEAICKYRSFAEESFRNYLKLDHSLLRTDYIRSSCCLDYAALLLESNNQERYDEVRELICKAEECASDALDVLQICAIYSLKINELDTSQRLLRKLVIEDYNSITNAQLLSYLYLNSVFSDKKYIEKTNAYIELTGFTDGSMLMPWPENADMLNDEEACFDRLRTLFYGNQKRRIMEQFNVVVDKIVEKNAIEYNKLLFRPRNEYDLMEDSFYLDTNNSIGKRILFYQKLKQNKDEWDLFVYNLKNKNIVNILNETLNETCRLLSSLTSQVLKSNIEDIAETSSIAKDFEEHKLFRVKEFVDRIKSETFSKYDCANLIRLSFTSFINDYIHLFKKNCCSKIGKQDDIYGLISIERELAEFCKSKGLPSPKRLYKEEKNKSIEKPREFVNILSYIEGGEVIKQNSEKEKEIKETIEEFIKNKQICSETKDNNIILFSTEAEVIREWRSKLSKGDLDYIEKRGSILAYFHDNKRFYNRYKDLYFLRDGLVLISNATLAFGSRDFYEYAKIQYDNEKHLLYIDGINSDIYSSEDVDVKALYNLIAKLGNTSSTDR